MELLQTATINTSKMGKTYAKADSRIAAPCFIAWARSSIVAK